MSRDLPAEVIVEIHATELGGPARIGTLRQLFRRVVFNVLTSHRDDHLRNHGFLRSAAGWRLAPAFDLNPMPDKAEHELSLDGSAHAGDLGLVIETAPFYRLTPREAGSIVDEVRGALVSWHAVVSGARLGRAETDLLVGAIDA